MLLLGVAAVFVFVLLAAWAIASPWLDDPKPEARPEPDDDSEATP